MAFQSTRLREERLVQTELSRNCSEGAFTCAFFLIYAIVHIDMTLEDNIFAKTKPVEKKLINYGFVETNGNYQLHTSICHGDFRVLIEVTKQGKVIGKVTDAAF